MINAALAALAGITASYKTVAEYENTIPLIAADSNNYFNSQLTIHGDLKYGTNYIGGVNENGEQQRGYGVKATAGGHITLDMEFFKWYKQSLDIEIGLFDVMPYAQVFFWTPLSGGFATEKGATGLRSIHFGHVQGTWYDNAKVCTDSGYAMMQDGRGPQLTCDYDENQVGVTKDHYIHFDLFEGNEPTWYGDTTWY